MENIKSTALYVRQTLDKGALLKDQERLLKYAQDHQFPHPIYFSDENSNFHGLTAMMEEIKAGRVGAVIITGIDRLGRDLYKVNQMLKTMLEHDIALITLNDPGKTLADQAALTEKLICNKELRS